MVNVNEDVTVSITTGGTTITKRLWNWFWEWF